MAMVKISDEEIVQKLMLLAQNERSLLGEVLRLLREAEKRKLYLDLGHSSLFQFCVEELSYTEHEAYARIQAMRLSLSVPEVEGALEAGRVGLTVAAMAQGYFRKAEKDKCPVADERKREIVHSLFGKSKRQSEKILAEHFPEPPSRQREQYTGNGRVKVNFTIAEDLFEDVHELFRIRSHTNPEKRWEKLLADLVKLGWRKWHPLRGAK